MQFRPIRVAVLVTAFAILVPGSSAAQPAWGPFAPPNPYLGPTGTSTMHGDASSSDATPLAGPGSSVVVEALPLGAACPTVLAGSDDLTVALCTSILGQIPTVYLFDRGARSVSAQLPLVKGSLLGGVYAYLDESNRLVAVDGSRRLVRVAHERTPSGSWRLFVETAIDLSGAISLGDNVTGLAPDWAGNVWFATGAGVVGVVDRSGGTRTVNLPAGERVQNSISTSPRGTAVATTHALYQLGLSSDGAPEVDWRAPYERGSARKPGQLSWGTGSTPTYFGPHTGSDFLTIVDNADNQVHLLVYRATSGELVCSQPVLAMGGPGSENSPIGIGSSVFVASTYGYPYPTVPDDAGPAVPDSAPFTGGMTRVDVDDSGCHVVWDNAVRSSAVPRLSAADGEIYTVTRIGAAATSPLDGFAYTVLDPASGAVEFSQPMPGTILSDTLQMSPLINANREILQGTITGIVRLAPR